MGQVYSKATEVRTWLGVGTPDNLLGMQKVLESDWDSMCGSPSESLSQEPKDTAIFKDEIDLYWRRLFKLANDARLASILELLRMKYWSRIWIVQECILAQTLVIQCGPHTVDAELFSRFARFVTWECRLARRGRESREVTSSETQRTTIHNFSLAPICDAINTSVNVLMIRLRSVMTESKDAFRLAELMTMFYNSQSADFHDHVYALLLLSRRASANVVPEYGKSRIDVFLEVALYLTMEFLNEQNDERDRHSDMRIFIGILAHKLGVDGNAEEDMEIIKRLPETKS